MTGHPQDPQTSDGEEAQLGRQPWWQPWWAWAAAAVLLGAVPAALHVVDAQRTRVEVERARVEAERAIKEEKWRRLLNVQPPPLESKRDELRRQLDDARGERRKALLEQLQAEEEKLRRLRGLPAPASGASSASAPGAGPRPGRCQPDDPLCFEL